ncbi:MAG: right-handed parallel beta-helix repeat-containing protein [Mariniphaga sp.]
MRTLKLLIWFVLMASFVQAREYHVSVTGSDKHKGFASKPFRTINYAAQLAKPGDVITVHSGTYRERINPRRGGESEAKYIVYRTVNGEKVEIKGSEIIKNWIKVKNETWKVDIPNVFFGSFNPYKDLIHGDWFDPIGRQHHSGSVYLNGEWLSEAARLDDVLKPVSSATLWFSQVNEVNTTIWAQFNGVNPNEQLVEINVRQTVFYPENPGINYIKVQGFTMCQAATPWAPPTAEQIGLIGTNWSKGWIIENNIISHSRCVGITLGKYGDEYDNQSANSAIGYVKTIERALHNGWNKETIGHHIVRNNTITCCEQAGIVGSMGAIFSRITGNTIHDIHVQRVFSGAERAGIKIHGAIDVEISNNHIYKAFRGIWLDWMAQGTRVSGNLLHDNSAEDLFVEVNHGPFLIDNNIFLSPVSLNNRSQGGAYVHNLFAGAMNIVTLDRRLTPFHKAHSTEIAGMHDNPVGDDRYYNNLFVERGDLRNYDAAKSTVWMKGNIFINGASPSKYESGPILKTEMDPKLRLTEQSDGMYLVIRVDKNWSLGQPRQIVTTELLGRARIPNEAYEYPNGTSLKINADYFGKLRSAVSPAAGPFEGLKSGEQVLKVW